MKKYRIFKTGKDNFYIETYETKKNGIIKTLRKLTFKKRRTFGQINKTKSNAVITADLKPLNESLKGMVEKT